MEDKKIVPDKGKYTVYGSQCEVRKQIEKRIISVVSVSQLNASEVITNESRVLNTNFLDYLMDVVNYSLFFDLDVPFVDTDAVQPDRGIFTLTLLEYALYSKALSDVFEFSIINVSATAVGIKVAYESMFDHLDNELVCALFSYYCSARTVVEDIQNTVSDTYYPGVAKDFMMGTFVDYYTRYAILGENFFVVDLGVADNSEMNDLLTQLSNEAVITYRKPDEFRAYMYFRKEH